MSATRTEQAVNVSLPEHLHTDLAALLHPRILLPRKLQDSLAQYVKRLYGESATELPYDLLVQISQWGQSLEGKETLKNAGLDSADYLRISLLSGLKTNPSSTLPPPSPSSLSQTPQTIASQALKDRRALTALINALFSIFGVGAATWKIAETTGWRSESRALLALFAAGVVAASEGILYAIWSSRSNAPRAPKATRKMYDTSSSKKIDSPDGITVDELEEEATLGLRRRLQTEGNID